jgi:hypothetical protein
MMLIPCADVESSDEGEGNDREQDANKPASSSSSARPSAAPSAAQRKAPVVPRSGDVAAGLQERHYAHP